MKSKVFLVLFIALFICVSCDIFGSKKDDTDEMGWKKTSLPGQLKGNWYRNNYEYMKITSSKVTVENREWGIANIHKKDNEIRFMVKSEIQYLAIYFRNITDTKVEKSFGGIMYTLYEAKTSSRENWIILTKE